LNDPKGKKRGEQWGYKQQEAYYQAYIIEAQSKAEQEVQRRAAQSRE
jgi:hypothetical protein